METGVSGGCGDTEAVIHPEKDGFVSLDFRDSRITDVPEGKLVSRAMMAGKRKFLVRSFFLLPHKRLRPGYWNISKFRKRKTKSPLGIDFRALIRYV